MCSAGPHPAAAAGSATTAHLSRRATASKCSLRRGHEEGLARHEEQAAGGGGTPSPPWTGPRFTTTNLGQSWAPQKSGGVQSAAARPARAAAQASSRQRGAWLQSPGCKGMGLITHWTTEATSGADRCGARCLLAAQRTPPPRRHCMHSPTSPAPHTTAHNLGLAALDAHRPADCAGPHAGARQLRSLGSALSVLVVILLSSCALALSPAQTNCAPATTAAAAGRRRLLAAPRLPLDRIQLPPLFSISLYADAQFQACFLALGRADASTTVVYVSSSSSTDGVVRAGSGSGGARDLCRL